jgi:hypothetical protein
MSRLFDHEVSAETLIALIRWSAQRPGEPLHTTTLLANNVRQYQPPITPRMIGLISVGNVWN